MRQTLLDMLTYCRPAGSRSEQKFIRRYLLTLPNAYTDPYRNVHVQIGNDPIVLWSAHTDTVHRQQGRQQLQVTGDTVRVNPRSGSSCLGADNTAGVYMLREMILRGVPGHYVFHYGEECGGIGSSDLADHDPAFCQQFKQAIAFDRRGTADVITYQGYGRCASDDYAWDLALAINAADPSLVYYPSDRGIFTDTANYMDHVPECTNISVGYSNEHGRDESLDLSHVDRLLAAVCRIDFSALSIKRDPAAYAGSSYTFDWDYWPNDRLTWQAPKQTKTDPVFEGEIFVMCTSCFGSGRDEYADVCRECLGIGEVLEYVSGTKAEIGQTFSDSLKSIGDRQARRTYSALRKLY